MICEDQEILLTYISEARELLDKAELDLLELQGVKAGADTQEIVNSVFRCFHSVKGAAAMLGFELTAKATHAAESLLSAYRKLSTAPTSEALTLLLQAVDLVRQLTAMSEAQKSEQILEPQVEDSARRLALMQAEVENRHAQQVRESLRAPKLDTSEFREQFRHESEELLNKVESSLLLLPQTPDNVSEPLHEAFRAMHSLKGNCGFMGYACLEQLAHRAETLLESLPSLPGQRLEAFTATLLKVVDALRTGIVEADRSGSCNEVAIRAALELLDEATLAARAEVPQAAPEREVAAANANDGLRQDVRVDLRRLDAMVNLASELVIAQSMVLDHPVLVQAEDEALARAVHMLRRVSVDLQDLSMALRMVPLAGAFRRLVRVVHDVSRKMNKTVKLELVGEETEVDKSVLELLSDPLVHLVRNAIDHGMETTAERRDAGKSDEGTVSVEARHAGGEILIVVRDDGRGLNRQRILAKAAERGLLKGDGRTWSDQQVFQLIFEPGFSTAAEVTDVSGRGVGMDVVRTNIGKLKGTIELRSEAGRGTSVLMHIPLTVAIIDGMLIRVGSARYTLPLLSIREALRPRPDQVTVTPDGCELVRIRDELLPVLRLHEVFQKTPSVHDLHAGILIVAEAQGQTACLFADEILGQQQAVIKALSGYLGKTRGVSGCTILGNGEVSLIVDVGALVALSGTKASGKSSQTRDIS